MSLTSNVQSYTNLYWLSNPGCKGLDYRLLKPTRYLVPNSFLFTPLLVAQSLYPHLSHLLFMHSFLHSCSCLVITSFSCPRFSTRESIPISVVLSFCVLVCVHRCSRLVIASSPSLALTAGEFITMYVILSFAFCVHSHSCLVIVSFSLPRSLYRRVSVILSFVICVYRHSRLFSTSSPSLALSTGESTVISVVVSFTFLCASPLSSFQRIFIALFSHLSHPFYLRSVCTAGVIFWQISSIWL